MDGQQNASPQPDEPGWQFKPGETISPRAEETAPAPQPSPEPQSPQPAPVAATVATPSPAQPAAADPASSQPSQSPPPSSVQPQAPEMAVSAPPAADPSPTIDPLPAPSQQVDDSITWTASEFIAHHKTAGWHSALIAGGVIFAVIVWFVTKDIVSPLVIVFAASILSFYGSRQPNQIQYQLSHQGLMIGQKYYDFHDFRSFSIVQEGAFSSIVLMPMKRFAPLTTLYYDPADEERVLGILGSYLPQQESRSDPVDMLMRRIRF